MSVLLVGVSHRTAPLMLLDQIASQNDSVSDLRADVIDSPYVAEAMVINTCNRIEIVADVSRFHGAVNDVIERLAKHSGLTTDELTDHVYVHFEERAVHHLFSVTSGLDSMIVGEQQISGQVRTALANAQEANDAGRILNDLGQTALRVGKRIHSTTDIDRHGASVVSVALDEAARILPENQLQAVVVGAGAMSSLALRTLAARGFQTLTITSRTFATSQRVADSVNTPVTEVQAQAVPLELLPELMAQADLLISATGANGLVITHEDIVAVLPKRNGRPLVVVDLALPHDTEDTIGTLPGVTRIDLAALSGAPGSAASQDDLACAREIIEEEVSAYLAIQAARRVEPIVVSLRAKAEDVVVSELERLRVKSPNLTGEQLTAIEQTLRRTVSNLLHTPTVRMKQFAADPDGQRYAEALHALFDLDQAAASLLNSTTDVSDQPNSSEVFLLNSIDGASVINGPSASEGGVRS